MGFECQNRQPRGTYPQRYFPLKSQFRKNLERASRRVWISSLEMLGYPDCTHAIHGGVAEWLKALVSKTSVRETVPGVRISPPPHLKLPLLLRVIFILSDTKKQMTQYYVICRTSMCLNREARRTGLSAGRPPIVPRNQLCSAILFPCCA